MNSDGLPLTVAVPAGCKQSSEQIKNRNAFRILGFYAGKILKGDNPADLPIDQAVKIELVLNLKTAKTLDITFPLSLLGRADEVIE